MEKNENFLFFHCCSIYSLSGFLTPCLMKKNAWGGRDSWDFTRDFFFLINQTFWWFEVLSAVLEAVTNETCYKVVFFFFSGQYLKDFISQGNSGLPQSLKKKKKKIIEKEWTGIVLIPELYSIHLKLIFFSFCSWTEYIFHACFPENRSINVIKKIIFFIKGYLYYRNYH